MFWPKTVENRAAIRTAFAALIAVLISFHFHLETPFWSGMSVVLITSLYTGHIINKAILRILGTITGAFLGFYAAGFVANSFLLYVLFCFLIVSVGAYYYSFSINGYAHLLGALCAFIIISQIAVNPEHAFFVAIWRPVEISIGVLVSALSVYCIFPNHLKDNIIVQLDTLFTDFSFELKQALSQADFTELTKDNLNIKRKIRTAVELVGAMNHELGVSRARTDEVRALLSIFRDLSRHIHYFILIASGHGDVSIMHSLSLTPVIDAIEGDLKQLQTACIHPSESEVVLKTGAAIEALEQELKQYHHCSQIQNNFIYALIHFLHQVNHSFNSMRSIVTHIPLEMAAPFQTLAIQERLRMDVDVIKRSIKAGFSSILALSFWMMCNWPGGLNGIISSLMISIRKNLFEMRNVSIHRLLGCVIGGSVALGSLFLCAMTLYDFIVIFFCSVWAFSYFMFKVPNYSYIGLQANVALIISLAQEGGPPIYLAPPLQRLSGIIIGIVASFLVANLLWRSDVWTMLNRYLNKIYLYMGQNLKQVLFMPPSQRKLHDLANLFWLSRGLLESLADEPLSIKKRSILTALTSRFDSLVMIQATLSHILLAIDREKVEKTASLLECNLALYEQDTWSFFVQHDAVKGRSLSQQIQGMSADLDKKAVFYQVSDEDLRGFLAYLNALNQLLVRIH